MKSELIPMWESRSGGFVGDAGVDIAEDATRRAPVKVIAEPIDAPPDLESPRAPVGTHWSETEDRILKALVMRMGQGRKSAEDWDQLAAQYCHSAVPRGYQPRTGSGCRHRAQKMAARVLGLTRVEPQDLQPRVRRANTVVEETSPPVDMKQVAKVMERRRPIQASFATPELATIVSTLVKTELADVLEDFANRLRAS